MAGFLNVVLLLAQLLAIPLDADSLAISTDLQAMVKIKYSSVNRNHLIDSSDAVLYMNLIVCRCIFRISATSTRC
jgi:hypothetical protein